MAQFIDCDALSVSYNIMGIATVTYTITHSSSEVPNIETSISAGGQTFTGYVLNVSTAYVQGSEWYETSVTLLATTN